MKIVLSVARHLIMVMKKNLDVLIKKVYIDKNSNYLKGIDSIFKNKDGFQLGMPLDYINPELSVIKTMSGSSALIQISKNKSLIFTVNGENLEIEKAYFG